MQDAVYHGRLDGANVDLALGVLVFAVRLARPGKHERFGAIEMTVVAFLHRDFPGGARIGDRNGHGNVHRNAAHLVDDVLETVERGHHVVVDMHACEPLHRSHDVFGIVAEKVRIDLSRVARHHCVARDGYERDGVVDGIDAHERDDVGILVHLRSLGGLAGVERRALARV